LWTRFFPVVKRLREEIKNKTIGEMKFMISNFMVPIKDKDRVKNREQGGGGNLE
jgi:predicted dehydrogenase